MNTKNNRRVQNTHERIIRAVYSFIWDEHRPLSKITVREVCEHAQINRSTFYAHYQDVFDVAERVEQRMAEEIQTQFLAHLTGEDFMRQGFTAMFRFFQTHRQFYLIYLAESNRSHTLELISNLFAEQQNRIKPEEFGYTTAEQLHYAQEFFKAGLSQLVYCWLQGGCKETPEELYHVLQTPFLFHSEGGC